jgi:hypothetical protein
MYVLKHPILLSNCVIIVASGLAPTKPDTNSPLN